MMKTVVQAFFCSLFIHILFIFIMYGWSYSKEIFGKVKLGERYVAESHTDVLFVFIGSPIVFIVTSFLGIAIVSAFLIRLTKKFLKARGVQEN